MSNEIKYEPEPRHKVCDNCRYFKSYVKFKGDMYGGFPVNSIECSLHPEFNKILNKYGTCVSFMWGKLCQIS